MKRTFAGKTATAVKKSASTSVKTFAGKNLHSLKEYKASWKLVEGSAKKLSAKELKMVEYIRVTYWHDKDRDVDIPRAQVAVRIDGELMAVYFTLDKRFKGEVNDRIDPKTFRWYNLEHDEYDTIERAYGRLLVTDSDDDDCDVPF